MSLPGFAAGALVATDAGDVPIEAVTTRHRARTNLGLKRILMTDAALAPSVAVRFSDGRTIVGAINAMACTKARKWLALWQLSSDDVIPLEDGTAVTVSSVVDAGVRWTYSLVVAKRAGFFVDGRLCC